MRALLVVEDEFLSMHVGVRRVVFHYWRELVLAGCDVTLASPDGRGGLYAREPSRWGPAVTEAMVMGAGASAVHDARPLLGMTASAVFPEAFDLVVCSAPWVMASVPRLRPHVGIVYDIVPNLLALGALRLPRFIEAGVFAELHDRGIRLMAAAGARLSCISRSTRDDIVEAYAAEVHPDQVVVDVPFDIDRLPLRQQEPPLIEGPLRVVLVNALDVRKGPDVAVGALRHVALETPVVLTVVGSPRMDRGDAADALAALDGLAAEFVQMHSPSDAVLADTYRAADVLLFPSYYEGLGLPVLEAQALGTPVVTCSPHGGGEFNVNPGLSLRSFDFIDVAEALIRAAGDHEVLRGAAVREALAAELATTRHAWWLPATSADLRG